MDVHHHGVPLAAAARERAHPEVEVVGVDGLAARQRQLGALPPRHARLGHGTGLGRRSVKRRGFRAGRRSNPSTAMRPVERASPPPAAGREPAAIASSGVGGRRRNRRPATGCPGTGTLTGPGATAHRVNAPYRRRRGFLPLQTITNVNAYKC